MSRRFLSGDAFDFGCDFFKTAREHEAWAVVNEFVRTEGRFDFVIDYPTAHPELSGQNILTYRVVWTGPDFGQKPAGDHRLQPCQSGSLGKSNVLRNGRRRPRRSIAEQSGDPPVHTVRLWLSYPRAGNRHSKMDPDFFQFGSPNSCIQASTGHPLNPAAPLLNQF